MTDRLWHGGVPGLRPGDVIRPDPDRTEHLVDGCPVCEARKAGEPLPDDDNNPSAVYVTSDREYARVYAAGWPRGDLYRVTVDGPMTLTDRDALDSWAVQSATVVAVYDRCVTLTPRQVRYWLRRTTRTKETQ